MEPDEPNGATKVAKSRKRGVVAYTQNPFVEPSTITTRRKRTVVVKGNKAIVDGETGQTEDLAEVVMVREVDDQQFVKLFTQNLRMFFDLSPVAMRLLQVVLHQVQQTPNNDKIMLNLAVVEDYFTRTHQQLMPRTSFWRAVRELLERKFIAESVISGLYFINPHLFFNGDRVRFVQELKRTRANDEHAQLKHRMDTSKTLGHEPKQERQIPEGQRES